MSAEIEKDPNEQVGGYLTFTYPKLPKEVDFEVFRKTDKDWKKLIEWYNGSSSFGSGKPVPDFNNLNKKERFVLLQWPRDPNGPPMKITPRGKDTGNGTSFSTASLSDAMKAFQAVSFGERPCMTSTVCIVFRAVRIFLRYVSIENKVCSGKFIAFIKLLGASSLHG